MPFSDLVEKAYRLLVRSTEKDVRVNFFTSSELLFDRVLQEYPRKIELIENRSAFAQLIPTYLFEGLEPALLMPILDRTPGDYLLRTTLRGDFVQERQGNQLSLAE